jgi:hypothetical protein
MNYWCKNNNIENLKFAENKNKLNKIWVNINSLMILKIFLVRNLINKGTYFQNRHKNLVFSRIEMKNQNHFIWHKKTVVK